MPQNLLALAGRSLIATQFDRSLGGPRPASADKR
jgi:hypothetical protein